jgi:hypothetical protein
MITLLFILFILMVVAGAVVSAKIIAPQAISATKDGDWGIVGLLTLMFLQLLFVEWRLAAALCEWHCLVTQ